MNAESKIKVHHSSLLDLKAELQRKKAEIEAVKSKQENALPNKSKVKSKKINEKQEKKEAKKVDDEIEDIETMKVHKKSRLMLEAKSRLYEQLSKTHTNMNPNFLVDFEHKPDDKEHVEEESQKDDSDYKDDYDSDSEWVEYVDCFGRTRTCLREDLPKMQQKDESVKKIIRKPSEEIKDEKLYYEDRMPEKEPEIEIMRRKWEEQTAKLANKADIHYQDVLFDEARTHGVGYYAFSQDEEERAKQQENLFKLRKETELKQKENQQIHEVKDRIQQNRLKAARRRQRIRAGLPPEETEEEKAANVSSNLEENEKYQLVPEIEETVKGGENVKSTNNFEELEKQEAAKRKLADIENKVEAFGELLGKRNRWYVMTQEEWVQKKRKERPNKFAPNYQNFQHGGSLELQNSINNSPKIDSKTEFSDSDDDIIGPLPPTVISPGETIIPQTPADVTTNSNVKIEEEEVEAGLKFLRQQFETKRT